LYLQELEGDSEKMMPQKETFLLYFDAFSLSRLICIINRTTA